MINAATAVWQVFVWLSRLCLWIVVAVLVLGLFQAAYFAAGFQSLLGCRFTVDTLFYFVCGERIADFLFNLPLLFAYAVASTLLGLPPSNTLAIPFYLIDAIVVLAVFRLLYLLFRLAKRAGARRTKTDISEPSAISRP